MSLGQSLIQNLGSALGGKSVTLVCGLVTYAILARHLGAVGLGEYRMVLTLLLFAGMAVDLGLQKITLCELALPGADQANVLGNAVALRAAATAVAVVVLSLLVTLSQLEQSILLGVLIAGAGWVAYQLSELMLGLFQQRLVQERAAVAEVAGAVTSLVLVFLLSRTDAGSTAMLGATAGGWLVTTFLSWTFAQRLVRFRPRIEVSVMRRMAIAGLPIAGSGLLMIAHIRGDVLMLAVLSGTRDVGIYDVAAKIYEILLSVPYMFAGLLLPLLVVDRQAGGSSDRRLQAAVAISLIVVALLIAVVMEHAESIATLLAGGDFTESGRVMRLLIVSFGFGAITAIVRFAAIAQEAQKTMLKADVVAVLLALCAYTLLVPLYGTVGAATGKLLGDVMTLAMSVWLLRATLQPSLLRAVPVAAASGSGLIGQLVVADRLGVHWLIAVTGCGLLTLAILYRLPFVRREITVLTRTSEGGTGP